MFDQAEASVEVTLLFHTVHSCMKQKKKKKKTLHVQPFELRLHSKPNASLQLEEPSSFQQP